MVDWSIIVDPEVIIDPEVNETCASEYQKFSQHAETCKGFPKIRESLAGCKFVKHLLPFYAFDEAMDERIMNDASAATAAENAATETGKSLAQDSLITHLFEPPESGTASTRQ